MRPVPVEKQWTLWPRIARPFACKTCGAKYGPTFDDEVESRNAQFMRWEQIGEAFWGEHHRVPRWRYCRNRDCARFYDYREEARRIAAGQPTMTLLPPGTNRRPMRRKWLKLPPAANDNL